MGLALFLVDQAAIHSTGSDVLYNKRYAGFWQCANFTNQCLLGVVFSVPIWWPFGYPLLNGLASAPRYETQKPPHQNSCIKLLIIIIIIIIIIGPSLRYDSGSCCMLQHNGSRLQINPSTFAHAGAVNHFQVDHSSKLQQPSHDVIMAVSQRQA